ncbi:MAG: ribbon-helix-helix domain-containing protein [Desulfurococcales archaeon]|nr:ribbon-helix-helix domain-containing protein [Desulfurococcales archaeon]
MFVTFTIRIPRKLAEKMKKYRGINWSEVIRRSIEEYLEKLEEMRTIVDARELLEELLAQGVDPKDLEPRSYEEEMEYYRVIGEREWKRLSMTRVQ